MNQEFKLGDVVTLKSSGPAMTIDSIDKMTDGNFKTSFLIHTIWFYESEIHKNSFIPECLKKLED